MADDWKSALRMLIRRAPSEQVVNTIIEDMRSNSSDRAAALLAAALADTALVGAIAYASQLDQSEINRLFWKRGGKFATFDSRIKRAAQLGVIGPKTVENLDVIRVVRNVFAHAMSPVEFTTPEIETACARLSVSDNAAFFVDREPQRKARYRYCYACDDVFRSILGTITANWIVGLPPTPGGSMLP